GHFLWPGFGENSRVLKWVAERCDGSVGAKETPIGYMPQIEDLDLQGLDIPEEDLEAITTIDPDEWAAELDAVEAHFESYGSKMPKELFEQLRRVRQNLEQD
ncbi:MAG: phosphoenolpyruvate carboxykinase domain-containing protein, partial [Clostridia bacterium]|nr:phosphoenolpyruvate carboxykinase domain-containing protein [Clostridia bacterium]